MRASSGNASTIEKMNEIVQNALKNHNTAGAFILDSNTPEDVSRAMIEDGYQKEPFYIFNMDEAHRRIQHFRNMMPRVQLFYAMKSNDTEFMLKLAIALGVGFDCASPGEIYKIRQLNVCPESIIYAMTTKTPEQMLYARDTGVKHTTFDSSYELKKLKKYWPDARLLIRIQPESDNKFGEKFGCDFDSEAVDLLEEAAYLDLKVVGVAFYVGSMCLSLDSFVVGLRRAKALFDHEARAGRSMKIVDIGGGFLSDRTDRIDEVSKLINEALEELFPDASVQVIAEPGRYFCDSSFKLFCNISNVKNNEKLVNMIYLNDGIYGTMRYSGIWQYGELHTLSKFKKSTETDVGDLEDAILWGPSCDSKDRVMKDITVRLPRCTALDWLVIDNHGAYTITASAKFSSLGIPSIRSVVSSELWAKLKETTVFKPSDFVLSPDISLALPSTMPPLLHKNEIYEHSKVPTLI